MGLKDTFFAKLERQRDAEAAAERPYQQAYAQLKALFQEIMGDRELKDAMRAEVELNGDELQIDPGRILIRASADKAGDFMLTYEIKAYDDPEIREIPVNSIADIEEAIASLLVEYPNVET